VVGLAFHVGARVAAKARAGEVLVSSAVKDLMSQSGIRFKDRGVHRLKGAPKRWRLYRVEQLMTQSGHRQSKIAAVQPDLGTPFRRPQIPDVISQPPAKWENQQLWVRTRNCVPFSSGIRNRN